MYIFFFFSAKHENRAAKKPVLDFFIKQLELVDEGRIRSQIPSCETLTIQQLLKTQKKAVSSISFITLPVFNMALFLYKWPTTKRFAYLLQSNL